MQTHQDVFSYPPRMATVPYSSEILCMHKISPSTDVHGCTTVEDGSNGLTVPIILRFCSTLPDAFALLLNYLIKNHS